MAKIIEDYKVVGPAYGRDYSTSREAQKAFLAGADFILQPQGCYCSVRDFGKSVAVEVRFNKLTKAVIARTPN